MKIFVTVFFLLSVAVGSFGMIETLSSNELILNSDLILIGKIIAIDKADESLQKSYPPQIEVLANKVEITENLTTPENKESVVIITLKGFEDDVSFEKDTDYLLFLKKEGDNYIVFNSPQGALNLKSDGTLSGMINLGVTLESAKKKIAETLSQKK